MLIYTDPFPGYTSQQDFILRMLLFAEDFDASELRFLREEKEIAVEYLIKGEWKRMPRGPVSRLWQYMNEGITSLLKFPSSLPEHCAGMIQSDFLKAIWLFYSTDVNKQLCFVKHDARKEDAA